LSLLTALSVFLSYLIKDCS